MRKIFFFMFMLIGIQQLSGQRKIDTDSLLISALNDANRLKDYDSAIRKSHLVIKAAPEYLDFHLLLGRAYQQKKQNDSARYYFNHVIAKNPSYQDAFFYLINLDNDERHYDSAMQTTNNAIAAHPNEKTFYLKKMVVFQLINDEKGEYEFLKTIHPKFPNDDEINQRIIYLESRLNSDRIGINYSLTIFDRNNYGPWHLTSINYIRERGWGSLIGRINYANRYSSGTVTDGLQYEAESYIFHRKKSYSYLGFAYSSEPVFPDLRFGYSFFHNFRKGWEADLGIRYTKSDQREFKAAVLGIGKYIGAHWLNFRTFIQNEKKEYYPAFTVNWRYYFNSRYDYTSLIAGYGTSPDERTTLGQFGQRVALDSYRIGGGYYKLFSNHFITGIQTVYNRQEYTPGLKQNEIEFSLLLQYKF